MIFSRPAWRVIALVMVAGFFWLATRNDVYVMTSPRSLARTLFGSGGGFVAHAHPWWLSLHIWVRKTYSIVAFTLVGFAANRALGPTPRPFLRSVAIVSTFSLGIEIAQRLFTAPEPNAESALDVACGALGGWLAVLADRAITENNLVREENAVKSRARRLAARKNL